MLERLGELIAGGEIREALYEFQEQLLHINEMAPKEASKLCVYEATLWESFEDSCAEFDAIAKGLSYNQAEYELFYMLGLYYININVDKSYLCMEMALHYCTEDEDAEVIRDSIAELRNNPVLRVRNVSIMILSYNDLEIMEECLDSIEETMPEGSFEVVVVDNASTQEGVLEFLRKRKENASYNFVLIENDENLGFARGCNIGAAACDPGNDIFFLNNDTVLTPNALFFLRMGLYEDRNVGAAGACSNSALLQEIPAEELSLYGTGKEAVIKYAAKKSVPMANPYAGRFRLTGFALLVSRDAIRAVAPDLKVFDEFFSPAYFEDDDLGFRIARAGFKQYLCLNSFIYHQGGSGFGGGNDLMEQSRRKFIEKWGFDIWGFCAPWIDAAREAIEVADTFDVPIRIIDFTCGMGATASYIKQHCPSAYVAGVCRNSIEASVARNMADEVVWGEMNTLRLPWKSHSFDIALADREYVSDGRIAECLKIGGIRILYSTQE